ncbi:NAD(P)H-binding protein [Thalassotalea sp. PLHSN55]|uniref:NAD(P)H-binding protein n=1 Tax=Thalassotalea sp. PLHSN55 TaxID=3435888 RepID=UPI003F83DAFB
MIEQAGKVAIVIGATGLVGRAVVEQLSQAKHIKKVIAITRSPASFHHNKVDNHVVDFENLTQHSASLMGDMLFSCLGTTKKVAGSREKQRVIDVDYQYQAAKLAAENGVHHYLLVSSNGANSNSRNQYLQMKGELEDKIAKLSFARVSIFRPSLLTGIRKNFRLGESLAAPLLTMLTLMPGLNKYQPISGDKVARKMVSISHHNNGAFELYELADLFS